MKYISLYLATLTTGIAHTAASDKPFSWAAIEARLIEQNPTIPELTAACSYDRCSTIATIYKNPIFCCGSSPRDNMLDQLACQLTIDGHQLLHTSINKNNRRALVERYLQHHNVTLNAPCCSGPSLPFCRPTVDMFACLFCFIPMRGCPVVFETIADTFCQDTETGVAPYDIAPALATLLACYASKCACDVAELCCYNIRDDINEFDGKQQ